MRDATVETRKQLRVHVPFLAESDSEAAGWAADGKVIALRNKVEEAVA